MYTGLHIFQIICIILEKIKKSNAIAKLIFSRVGTFITTAFPCKGLKQPTKYIFSCVECGCVIFQIVAI